MTDTTLIEEMRKAKVRLKGISLGSEMDICVVEHSTVLIDLAIEALEQSQWVSVKDLTIIEDERYLVFDPDQNHPSMIFRLMDGQFIKSVSEDCQAVLVTPPTQESDT